MGMVLQDTWLFKGTVKENIAYGKDNATNEEIIDAAKRAYAHEFIMQLPAGNHGMRYEGKCQKRRCPWRGEGGWNHGREKNI